MCARISAPDEEGRLLVARNPRATHDYHILETWEAGLVLTGTEVKSLRSGKASIKEGFARLAGGQVWLEGVNVTPYEQGNRYNHDPVRSRKLLLHRREIERLIGAVEQKGPRRRRWPRPDRPRSPRPGLARHRRPAAPRGRLPCSVRSRTG